MVALLRVQAVLALGLKASLCKGFVSSEATLGSYAMPSQNVSPGTTSLNPKPPKSCRGEGGGVPRTSLVLWTASQKVALGLGFGFKVGDTLLEANTYISQPRQRFIL